MLAEMRDLDLQIQEADNEFVTDVVMGSGDGPAYAYRSIKVEGVGDVQKKSRLLDRRRSLAAVCEAVECAIGAVDDSRTRRVLAMRYVLGRTIEESAEALDVSTATVDRRLKTFFME